MIKYILVIILFLISCEPNNKIENFDNEFKEKICLDNMNRLFSYELEGDKIDSISFINKNDFIENFYNSKTLNNYYFIRLHIQTNELKIAIYKDSIDPEHSFNFCGTINGELFIDLSLDVYANLTFLNSCGLNLYISKCDNGLTFAQSTYTSELIGKWKNTFNSKKIIEIQSNNIMYENTFFDSYKFGSKFYQKKDSMEIFDVITYSKNKMIISFPNDTNYYYYDRVVR